MRKKEEQIILKSEETFCHTLNAKTQHFTQQISQSEFINLADCGENMGTHRSRLGVTFCVKESRLREKIKGKTQLWQENDYGYG